MSDLIKREDATAVIRKTLGSLGNSVITEVNSLSGYATQDYARFTQESTQDLISREDAIETVGDWMVKEFGYLDLNRGERLIDAFEALPSAEPKTGRWIFNTGEHTLKSFFICSECGGSIFHESNYCPNCGAKMEGGEE